MVVPSGSRVRHVHRLVLLCPLVLLTLTCLYHTSYLSPYNASQRLSFAHDAQCFSCETSSFPSRAFLSLANFPTTSFVKDVVLRHKNALRAAQDSRGEALPEPGVALDERGTEAERKEAEPDVMSRIRKEKLSHDSSFKKTVSTVVRPNELTTEEGNGDAPPAEDKDVRVYLPGDTKVEDSDAMEVQSLEAVDNLQVSLPTENEVEDKAFSSDVESAESQDGTVSSDVESVEVENLDISLPTESSFEESAVIASDLERANEEGAKVEYRHLTSNQALLGKPEVEEQSADNVMLESSEVPVLSEDYNIKYRWDNMSKELIGAGTEVEKLMDRIKNTGLPKLDENPSSGELILMGGVPQGTPAPELNTCEGRRVFVYDLPSKFNADLVAQCHTLLRWFDFCAYFMNEGMGTIEPTDELNDKGERVLVPDGSWYLTHQYDLELIFHARLKHYPCLTTDPNRANLFFVPYYAGLDVIRWHFRENVTNELRDELTHEMMSWLESQESWKRHNGLDHVLVLGKIGWDFRRPSDAAQWGSKLLRLPSMFSPTKLLIERDPWHENDVGVPHPTFFHPKNDDEIRTWLAHIEQSERRHLVSFAGMPRPKMLGNVRGHLIQQCLDQPDDCFLLRCEKLLCLKPVSTMNLFLHSHFCMQPPGDSPTRRSVFDSLIGGCIPVLFDPYTAYYQYPWHLPHNASYYSVYIPSPHIMEGRADIVGILKSISAEERNAMRMRIIREIVPGLLYAKPGSTHSAFRDAFDISMEALLNRVAKMRAEGKF